MFEISKFLLSLLLLVNLLSHPKAVNANIIPLITEGSPGNAKYIVSLRFDVPLISYGDNHFCGGSIISDTKILTAAHCVTSHGRLSSASDISVITGCIFRLEWTHKTQGYKVKSIVVHPDFKMDITKGIFIADIAILVLKRKIYIDGVITGIVPLATETPAAGTLCTVLGWGRIFEFGPMANELLNVNISIWTYQKCLSVDRGLSPCFICAGDFADNGKGACQGDSGGPFICNNYLTGVVSYGMGCGYSSWAADFYTEVACHYDWIMKSGVEVFKVNYKLMASAFLVVKFKNFLFG